MKNLLLDFRLVVELLTTNPANQPLVLDPGRNRNQIPDFLLEQQQLTRRTLLLPPDLLSEQQKIRKIPKLKLPDFLSEQQKVTTNPLLGDLHSAVSEVPTTNLRGDFPVSELQPL